METVILPHADYRAQWEELSERIVDVEGDIAEFGVYNGGGSRALSSIFPERTVWAFDTYLGIPRNDYIPGMDQDSPGDFASQYSLDDMFGEYPNVIPVRGRFSETLPMFPLRPKIAFAYLDSDLYNSTKDALWWLQTHLSLGAIIFLDDYSSHKSVRKAIDEFVLENNVPFDGRYVITWRPHGS